MAGYQPAKYCSRAIQVHYVARHRVSNDRLFNRFYKEFNRLAPSGLLVKVSTRAFIETNQIAINR